MPDDESLPALPGSPIEAQRAQDERERLALRQEPTPTLGERVSGGVEVLGSTVFGGPAALAGQILGGVEGAARELLTGQTGSGLAEETAERRMQQFSEPFAPVTEEGKRQAGIVGEALEPLASLPPVLPTTSQIQALKGPAKARAIRRAKLSERVQEVVDNPQSAKNVEFTVVNGKRVKDAQAVEALKQGFNAPSVAFAKGASKVDKNKFSQMLDIKERALDDLGFAANNRPSDIVGSSLEQRVKHIARVNRSAGSRIDKVAKGLEGKKVNLAEARKGFFERLANEGVEVVTNPETGRSVASFKGSSFEGETLKTAQKAINSMIGRLEDLGDNADALSTHRAKRFIDENITLGGKGGEGLRGRSQNIILALRKGIDDSLDSKFRDYKRINDRYSQTIDALNTFQDSVGRKVDFTAPNADKALGSASRRFLSNVQSRQGLLEALDKIERISDSTGAKFTDDVVQQAQFANILDDAFGSSAQRGLASEVGKGTSGAKIVRAAEAPLTAVAEGVAEKVASARGINTERAFEAMRRILSRNADN
jgi:hypothetical protein